MASKLHKLFKPPLSSVCIHRAHLDYSVARNVTHQQQAWCQHTHMYMHVYSIGCNNPAGGMLS